MDASPEINSEIYKIVMEYKEKYHLPDELVYIYLHAIYTISDLYVDGKVYLSLKQANRWSEIHQLYFDFSLVYYGMGWVNVYSWHSKLNKIVKRMDGTFIF